MDDARKLLDSLMGTHRNLDRKTLKEKKGQAFLEDNICKHYLVGFCPRHEALFQSTKRDLGPCSKVHSDAMKEELEQHPEREKYTFKYEMSLRRYLEDLVRSADDWAARERRNVSDSHRTEDGGPSEVAKAEIKKLQDQASALLKEAEESMEKGNLQGSKALTEKANELQKKAQDWEDRAKSAPQHDVCDICGSRMETGDVNYAKFRHAEGKVHLGYIKIREFLRDLRQRIREKEQTMEKESEGRRGRGDRSRSRDSGRRDGGRDRDRDRERDRDYGRRDRSRGRRRGDRGDRDGVDDRRARDR